MGEIGKLRKFLENLHQTTLPPEQTAAPVPEWGFGRPTDTPSPGGASPGDCGTQAVSLAPLPRQAGLQPVPLGKTDSGAPAQETAQVGLRIGLLRRESRISGREERER